MKKKIKSEKPGKIVVLVRTYRGKDFMTIGFDQVKNARDFLEEAVTKGNCEAYLYQMVKK